MRHPFVMWVLPTHLRHVNSAQIVRRLCHEVDGGEPQMVVIPP